MMAGRQEEAACTSGDGLGLDPGPHEAQDHAEQHDRLGKIS